MMLLTNDIYSERPSIPRYKHMSATIIPTALPPFMDQVQRSPLLSWITNIIPATIGMPHFRPGSFMGAIQFVTTITHSFSDLN